MINNISFEAKRKLVTAWLWAFEEGGQTAVRKRMLKLRDFDFHKFCEVYIRVAPRESKLDATLSVDIFEGRSIADLEHFAATGVWLTAPPAGLPALEYDQAPEPLVIEAEPIDLASIPAPPPSAAPPPSLSVPISEPEPIPAPDTEQWWEKPKKKRRSKFDPKPTPQPPKPVGRPKGSTREPWAKEWVRWHRKEKE